MLMRDSQQVEDEGGVMQSPPTELGQTNGRISRVSDNERHQQ